MYCTSKSKQSNDSADQDAIREGVKWIPVAYERNTGRAFAKRALGFKEFHK
jgi:hypothetical protein